LDWQCVECCTGDLCNYYVTVSCCHLLSTVTVRAGTDHMIGGPMEVIKMSLPKHSGQYWSNPPFLIF